MDSLKIVHWISHLLHRKIKHVHTCKTSDFLSNCDCGIKGDDVACATSMWRRRTDHNSWTWISIRKEAKGQANGRKKAEGRVSAEEVEGPAEDEDKNIMLIGLIFKKKGVRPVINLNWWKKYRTKFWRIVLWKEIKFHLSSFERSSRQHQHWSDCEFVSWK